MTALRAILPESVDILVGLDDAIVEGVAAGATGWIAGLINAYPAESVRLFELARDGRAMEAAELYRWFLPLLRGRGEQVRATDQVRAGGNRARQRPRPRPRLELTDAEKAEARAVIEAASGRVPVGVGA